MIKVLLLALSFTHTDAASTYPPVAYLASELGFNKTQPLPKGVIYNGRPFFAYIVSARAVGNGEYDVRIVLR